jgi:hypothetical protein
VSATRLILIATEVTRGLPGLGPPRLAVLYVLSIWIVAGGITLWIYLARSLASFSGLLAEAARALQALCGWSQEFGRASDLSRLANCGSGCAIGCELHKCAAPGASLA